MPPRFRVERENGVRKGVGDRLALTGTERFGWADVTCSGE